MPPLKLSLVTQFMITIDVAGDANRIHCESDGLWSLSASYCKVMCDGPPTVKNATIISTVCRAGDHVVGTKCRLRCERGYYVQGFTSRK